MHHSTWQEIGVLITRMWPSSGHSMHGLPLRSDGQRNADIGNLGCVLMYRRCTTELAFRILKPRNSFGPTGQCPLNGAWS